MSSSELPSENLSDNNPKKVNELGDSNPSGNENQETDNPNPTNENKLPTKILHLNFSVSIASRLLEFAILRCFNT